MTAAPNTSHQTRSVFALLIFILFVHIAILLPQNDQTTEVSRSYAVTTCPGPINGARSVALLPSKAIGIRDLTRKASGFSKPTTGTPNNSGGAIVISGNPRDTLNIQSKESRWTTAVTCGLGDANTWFIGGTANVTSQGKLVMINSGLSDAQVEVTAYDETGPKAANNISVRALSEKVVRIDSLDPGAESLVLEVKVLNGRVTSYLLDERVRGLNNLGGDFVSPNITPGQVQIIPGLVAKYGNSGKINHTLRVINVSDSDTSASVEILSKSGVYIPVGLGDIKLNAKTVVDVPLRGLDLGKENFAVKIEASSPIAAAVRTELVAGSLSDFSWSVATPSFRTLEFNLYGLEPTITFVGERIAVLAEWKLRDGKSSSRVLTGEEIVNWKVPANVRLVRLINRGTVSAGMIWVTRDGIAALPVTSAASLESAVRPITDISVIQSRT
ncbi:MAG: DUF5719 family protein [Actinomycetales bacterium]